MMNQLQETCVKVTANAMVWEIVLHTDGVKVLPDLLLLAQCQNLVKKMNVESYADLVLLLVNVIVKAEKMIVLESAVELSVLMYAVSVVDQVCHQMLVIVTEAQKIVMVSVEVPLYTMSAVSVTVQVFLNTNAIVNIKS
jgi:hypothetical protein